MKQNESMYNLLKKRTFLPLFLTQFFGAFNDNAFKLAMLTLISYHLSKTQSQSEHYQAVAGALFTLPFFLFSATAGQLADKYDKALLTRLVKFAEILLMLLGSLALYKGSIVLMLLTLTGMGVHSTFFGPIKYAILPDHLQRSELLNATALIEASTFLAILLGTILGTLAVGSKQASVGVAVLLINSAALIGFVASWFIPGTNPQPSEHQVDWHLWHATRNMLDNVIKNRQVYPAVFAISWFWLIGAIMLTKLPDYTHYVLQADTTVFALFLALFSIGIAGGSLAISLLLKGRITITYVPFTMLLLSVFAMDLFWATPAVQPITEPLLSLPKFLFNLDNLRITMDFFLFSVCGGLFVVPLYTYLQISCEENKRARTIAANNICNALAMVIGSLLVMLMLKLKLSIAVVFLVMAISNTIASVALWLLTLRPAKTA
ncbi:MFS transporter [Legionella dresdenensis]|uniref:MFS transporter n=1 Tax=Legionella dresdenensis TaxID=450200 RepID=A0ABV8CC35_9GAMM